MPAGPHRVLVETDDGRRWYGELTLEPGAREELTARPRPTSLGREDDPVESSRSRSTQRLYRELARVLGTDFVVVAGIDEGGTLRIALVSGRTSTLSRAVEADLRGAPPKRAKWVAGLVARVLEGVGDDGLLREEAVDTKVPPLRIGGNPTLDDALFGVEAPRVVVVETEGAGGERTPPKPGAIVAAILGIAGGGAAAATAVYFGLNPPTGPSGTVTITFP